MHALIIGSLSGPLGLAAKMAVDSGVKLRQSDTVSLGMASLRRETRVDLVFCEVSQDLSGLLKSLVSERMRIPVIACGVDTSPKEAAQAIRDGALEFLPLPPEPDIIAAILQAILNDSANLIALDPAMSATLRFADQVAASNASILIHGESGTGKEVLARYIHRRSKCSAGAFIAVNCAAIPENLLESELFGHEKGAFSGASARRIGKFEAANGGTLLLDEISEMDIRLQAKLLRALQEREIDRVGGSSAVSINVRFLATTNRNLLEHVASGSFREDLYFRLNVVALRVPPLRERPADVAALSEHFSRKYAEANGLPYRRFTADAITNLSHRQWRGNVRELENVIHRAVLLATGDTLDSGLADTEFPYSERASPRPDRPPPSTIENDKIACQSGSGRIDELERDAIIKTLHLTMGNRTHAATILGISIRTLRNKLKEYSSRGIAVPSNGLGAVV